ncbi:MAG: hypothetical protein MHMPM18_003294 [Marteilia pararefringens]
MFGHSCKKICFLSITATCHIENIIYHSAENMERGQYFYAENANPHLKAVINVGSYIQNLTSFIFLPDNRSWQINLRHFGLHSPLYLLHNAIENTSLIKFNYLARNLPRFDLY